MPGFDLFSAQDDLEHNTISWTTYFPSTELWLSGHRRLPLIFFTNPAFASPPPLPRTALLQWPLCSCEGHFVDAPAKSQ
jgi:hypothetical protein